MLSRNRSLSASPDVTQSRRRCSCMRRRPPSLPMPATRLKQTSTRRRVGFRFLAAWRRRYPTIKSVEAGRYRVRVSYLAFSPTPAADADELGDHLLYRIDIWPSCACRKIPPGLVRCRSTVLGEGCACGSRWPPRSRVACSPDGLVLLRLAYLTVTNAFAVLCLLPMGDRAKDVEILALRHRLAVLQRQLGQSTVTFTPADRAFLAALLQPLSRTVLRRLQLLVRPDTVLRWHRDLTQQRQVHISKRKRRGRPPTVRSIRTLVLRLVRENPPWGYPAHPWRTRHPGSHVGRVTVWEILRAEGVDPAHNDRLRPGPTSCAVRPRRCWPSTSSRRSP